ncbi:MAG: nicotinate-nucleotide adenylyltransferase [Proteobacteria bacterium]|nr:nicotinate-nucleotide adenylyltransferase [Pseudomonadota bacterium]MBU0965645.1 nicotinate-nucleotide adenylyltransferase [Pseudomonadota bacterium]
MHKIGVIHGRFQLLHNDHLKYLLAGKERCEHLVVGITNPDPTLTKRDSADPARSSREANPFTYFERYCMVRDALADEGLRDEISIVPFPINFPELYHYYLPMQATFFLTIYDDWGEKKLRLFNAMGLATEILWRRPRSGKGLSSTEIRQKMMHGEQWEGLVPPAVARLVKKIDLQKRLEGKPVPDGEQANP